MSNNRSASAKVSTLANYYNDFFSFVLDLVVPCLPEKIKNNPEISSILSTIPGYCNNDKNFVLVHYGVLKKACTDPSTIKTIQNITELVDDSENSQIKLRESSLEIKNAARHVSEICRVIIESSDETIIENVEKFCLFVEILTKQFVPPKQK